MAKMNIKTILKKNVFAKIVSATLISVGFTQLANAQSFTPGNLVVLQTKGTASKGPSQAKLYEFTPSGTPGINVAIDSTSGATNPFLTAGQFGGSESFLTTSTDGKFLVLGGYGTYTVTADITATTAANIKRVVGKVDASGTYTQMYSSNTFYSGNDIRGAVSDGTNFWVAGASAASVDGIDYFGSGTPVALAVAAAPPKAYGIRIFNNQIYYSTQKAGPNNTASNLGICALNGGMPTSGTVTVSAPVINTGTLTPQDFSFSNDGKTCYVAINLNTAAGGIQKWTNTTAWATTGWSLAYTLGIGVTNIGAYGIVVDYSGANPVIYATTTEAQTVGNRVIKIIDAGSGSTATTLIASVIGTTNKGISFAPCSSAPTSVIASSNSPLCANANLNLTASATGAISFSWSGPNSFTSTSQNPSINNTTIVASGVYTLTTTNGCGTTTATTTVTVNALPAIYNVTGGGTDCQGGSGVAVGLDNSATGVNYQLMNGASNVGLAVAGTGTVISFPNQTTAATYTVVASDATSSCTSNMNGNAVVIITPTVTPSANINASPSNIICSGTNVTFSATTTNSGSTPIYQWMLNGTNVGSNIDNYSNNALNNGDVIVCALTSNATCATQTTVVSNTITINVTTSVVPALNIISTSGTSNCNGTNVTFSATPTNGGTTPTYQWILNGTNVGTNSATYVNNTLADQDIVSCMMASSNGCAIPTTATANSLTMTVVPNVTPSVSISTNPIGAICAGTGVTFSATATNGGTPVYEWTKNGNAVGSNSATYTDANLANNDVVACILTSNANCLTVNTASAVVTTTVNSNPTPTITGTLSFCPSNSTTLDAGTGYASYLWSNSATTQTISVTAGGTYSVLVSDGTCNGTSTTVTVTALNNPTQPGAFTTSSASVLLGQTGVVYTVPNDPTVTYNWTYSGAGATINGTGNSVSIDFSSSATSGTLSVTATNNCGTSAATSMSITASLQPSFTSGNLVLLQTSGTVNKAASAITLKEITTSGAAGISVAIPNSGPTPFETAGIFGGSEGFLTTSTDKQFLVLTGYSTTMSSGDITATSALTTPRAVGVVYPSGFFQQVYSSTTNFDGNDIRGAVSDGTNFWASGASSANVDGIDYYGPGTPAGLGTNATPPKAYAIRIFNGQIYYSTQKAGPTNTTAQLGIFSMGSGLPTSGTPTPTQVINTGTVVVEDFSINPTTDICYIAVNLNSAVGGIQKWVNSAGTWSLAYTLGTGIANTGAYGLVVDYSGANPVIYATTFDAGGNRVIKITDTGAGSTASTILAATPNTYYKGITFAPVASGLPVVNLTVSQDTASEALATSIVVTAHLSSAAVGTQTVALNVTGTNITSGDYVVTNTVITIPSGYTSGTVTFTVVNDALPEALIETAILTITNPSSGIVLGTVATQNIAIRDNDGNNPPTIVMDVANTTDYIDGEAATSPVSPYTLSGTMTDPTDPASTLGINFIINDQETAAGSLTVTVASSDTTIVPTDSIKVTGTGASRNVKISPIAIGYSNVTVSVSDGLNTSSYIIYFASSDPSPILLAPNTFWHTGLSDASDAIAIDDNYYMTGDDELDYVNVYSRNHSGLPAVSFDATSYLNLPDPTAKPEVDIEAATESKKISNRSYWLGSMSTGKAPYDVKPNRDRLFATHHTGTGESTVITFVGYGAIRSALLAWGDANGYDFSTSAAAGMDSKAYNGFSVEGMVFGPDSTTLWIGLRAPLVPTVNRTKAVIAPILNFETWFNNGNQTGNPTFGAPIELDLNMNGIRDIIRLSNGTYIIVAGSPLDNAGSNELYKWTGNPADAPIHVPSLGGGNLNMEGAMEVHTNGNLSLTQIQVICDYGANVLYNDNNEAKDFTDLNLRKFRSDLLTNVDLNICTGYSVAINSSNGNSFCAGDSATLTANANNTSSYVWSNSNTASHIVIKNSGTYSVTATNIYSGCKDTSAIAITVNALPNTPTITQNSNVLTASAASTYQWYYNGNIITGATSQTYTATQNGNYQVIIGDANTCTAISNTVTVTNVGIAGLQNNLQGAVTKPNPFENYFDLDFSAEAGNYSVELYNAIGERVATLFKGELATGNIHFTFNTLPELRNGIYFLKIQTGSSYQVLKICQAK